MAQRPFAGFDGARTYLIPLQPTADMKLPYLYRASWSKDGSTAKSTQGQPSERIEAALADAHEAAKHNKAVTILKDDRGEFHPDNAGKFFLHRIVK